MKTFITYIFILLPLWGFAQGPFAGPVDSANTTAIHMDSSIIHSWAVNCELQRGFRNIKDTSLGKTSVGADSMATGKALSKGVISLGDKGKATLSFGGLIYNGPGPDIAVFENAFDDNFLELAFVEVSSDGQNFFRFPALSHTDTAAQVKSYDSLSCSNIHNLAGKYRMGYGTPFDLEELKGISGLDVDKISHVRIIDVGGSIDSAYASRDSKGRMINDPFPTAWPNGGFDLDAVAVMYLQPTGMQENAWASKLVLFPNPATDYVEIKGADNPKYILYNSTGIKLLDGSDNRLNLGHLASGMYFLFIQSEGNSCLKKIIKR